MSVKFVKGGSSKEKENNDESSMESKIEYHKDKDCYSLDKKMVKRTIEANDESKNKKIIVLDSQN